LYFGPCLYPSLDRTDYLSLCLAHSLSLAVSLSLSLALFLSLCVCVWGGVVAILDAHTHSDLLAWVLLLRNMFKGHQIAIMYGVQ
jgi:hypothetical protein